MSVSGRPVLRGVDLELADGEVHLLFGPNGAGKTALLMTIMGLHPVSAGKIMFRGEDVTELPIEERARRGMALFYQRPPTAVGLSLRDMAFIARGDGQSSVEGMAERLRCTALLERDLNDGFSGGEIKLSELLQLMLRRPRLALVDEPDSGVDLENLELVGSSLRSLFEEGTAGLVITHSGRILDWVRATRAHILAEGRLVRSGEPAELLASIREGGYR